MQMGYSTEIVDKHTGIVSAESIAIIAGIMSDIEMNLKKSI